MSILINDDFQPQDLIVEKKIGFGTFGTVYSCSVKNKDFKVALKRIEKRIIEKSFDPEYLMNCYWLEINSMKKCECENSVKFLKSYESKNNYNIVMELCDSNLKEELKKHPNGFNFEEIKEILLQLNNAFKKLHEYGLIHRDLKLENILIKEFKESHLGFIPKLGDYGTTKELENKKTNTFVGTEGLMAPEIIKGEKYNSQADLWSLGSIIYYLFFCELPYPPKQSLYLYKQNYKFKQTKNPLFNDLINKLLLEDPNLRLNWEDYFNHPFFIGEKISLQIENVSNNIIDNPRYKFLKEFDTGIKTNQYKCSIAKDIMSNEKVLIKSYFSDFVKTHKLGINFEFLLFKSFQRNEGVINIINMYKNSFGTHFVFQYIGGKILSNFIEETNSSEDEIKIINYKLFQSIFKYNNSNFKSFNFISIYSFLITNNNVPILFDFGIHRFFLAFSNTNEFINYFLPNKKEIGNTLYPMKTNVMNYGITLLNIYYGNDSKMRIKGNEISVLSNKKISKEFSNFLSKCLLRDIRQRSSWDNLRKDKFITKNNINIIEKVNSYVLLNNEKLEIIFEYLETKFDLINDYFSKIELTKKLPFIEEVEIFLILTLFEQLIIIKLFDRDENKHPFTFQQEISFMSIDSKGRTSHFNLNFANPILKDTKIINLSNNKLIDDFISSLKIKITKLKEICLNIHTITKSNLVKQNYSNFLQSFINSLKSTKFNKFFFSLIKPNSEEELYNIEDYKKVYEKLLIAEYICHCILFVKEDLFESEKDIIIFNKEEYLKQFNDIFHEDEKLIEMSVLKLKKEKEKYILFSFLGSLYKYFKNSLDINDDSFEANKNELDILKESYPNLIKKIIEIKKRIGEIK